MIRNRRIWTAIITLGLVILGGRAWWAWRALDKENATREIHLPQGISADYILAPTGADPLSDITSEDFDVTPDGAVLIGGETGLLALKLDDGGLQAQQLADQVPGSFTSDGQGAMLTISDGYFGQLENGQFSKLVPLPYQRMRLMPSSLPAVVYLIGGEGDYAGRVYTFTDDGIARILAEVPEPVVAVCDNEHSVYLASKHALFRVNGQEIQVVMHLPDSVGEIVSLAAAPDDRAIFFSTDQETFIVSGKSAIALTRDLGGTLRERNGRLYIWSRERHLLVSLSGISEFLERLRL
jgi:hypothetical protein